MLLLRRVLQVAILPCSRSEVFGRPLVSLDPEHECQVWDVTCIDDRAWSELCFFMCFVTLVTSLPSSCTCSTESSAWSSVAAATALAGTSLGVRNRNSIIIMMSMSTVMEVVINMIMITVVPFTIINVYYYYSIISIVTIIAALLQLQISFLF